jgi:hypothetical protein
LTFNHLIFFGIIYAICSISEPFLQKILSLNSKSNKRRFLLASAGILKFAILLVVLLKYSDPLFRDLKSNGLKIDSLSAFAIILWVQQMIDCISGILSSQLKAG